MRDDGQEFKGNRVKRTRKLNSNGQHVGTYKRKVGARDHLCHVRTSYLEQVLERTLYKEELINTPDSIRYVVRNLNGVHDNKHLR